MQPQWRVKVGLIGLIGTFLQVSHIRAHGEATLIASQRAAPVPVRTEIVDVDGQAPGRPFPHNWERMFGSGRAILTLRESYRRDLREVKAATDFEYVRFHAIFHDEVGVYDEDANGRPIYIFSYVDQIYDGLLANGVRLRRRSFMPKAPRTPPFHPLVQADRRSAERLGRWRDLITNFARHLVAAASASVALGYFEVWNRQHRPGPACRGVDLLSAVRCGGAAKNVNRVARGRPGDCPGSVD